MRLWVCRVVGVRGNRGWAERRAMCKTRLPQAAALYGLRRSVHTTAMRSTGDQEAAVGVVGKSAPTAGMATSYPIAQNYTAEI